jgi:ribosomal-protein-alanine N-acetyltransferase
MLTPDDAPRMLGFASENREHLDRWDPARPDGYFTLEFWRNALDSWVQKFENGTALRLTLMDRTDPSGRIHGHCSFTEVVRGPFQAAFLGYSLDHRSVGQGLMFEALTAAIRYAFEEMNLHRLMANYQPTNERSGRLLRRLGFTVEGYARDYLLIAGEWRDHVLTSLINHEWKPGES